MSNILFKKNSKMTHFVERKKLYIEYRPYLLFNKIYIYCIIYNKYPFLDSEEGVCLRYKAKCVDMVLEEIQMMLYIAVFFSWQSLSFEGFLIKV